MLILSPPQFIYLKIGFSEQLRKPWVKLLHYMKKKKKITKMHILVYVYVQKEATLPLAAWPAATFSAIDMGLGWITEYIYMNVKFIPWFERPH